jgi:hypothetical protein
VGCLKEVNKFTFGRSLKRRAGEVKRCDKKLIEFGVPLRSKFEPVRGEHLKSEGFERGNSLYSEGIADIGCIERRRHVVVIYPKASIKKGKIDANLYPYQYLNHAGSIKAYDMLRNLD